MPADPVKLLIVDDVPANLDALEALLGSDDVSLLRACSGPEALELLLIHDVALALLDVQMPGMDGFELAELMRGSSRTKRIPIIFLTAVATDERRRFRGYETGAVDYLLKPVDAHVVRSKVEIFCELARHRQELARHRDDLAAALSRLQAHTDNSPLATVEFAPDQRITAWSGGAERLFGHSAQEMVGRRLSDLAWLGPDERSSFAALVQEMQDGGRLREMQAYRANHLNGTRLDCEWYCSALLDAAGRLSSINVQILDVTERKRAEATQQLLVGELNHRVKNTLATVQAITTQTMKHTADRAEFEAMFIGRIHALARAHSLLSDATWQGAKLRDLIEAQLQMGTVDEERLILNGPELEVPADKALRLALILHELTTNANKYGALSNAAGRVELAWRLESGTLEIAWTEQDGPLVRPPAESGFGTTLIKRGIESDGGQADVAYLPEGARWNLRIPLQVGPSAEIAKFRPGVTRPPRDAPPSLPGGPLRHKRFLVIEDEPIVGMEVEFILNEAGAESIGPATTVKQALELIASVEVDGALLDGNLQGESVERVAEALTVKNIPFAFASGYGVEHLPKGYTAPVLQKPFEARTLVECAASLCMEKVVAKAG